MGVNDQALSCHMITEHIHSFFVILTLWRISYRVYNVISCCSQHMFLCSLMSTLTYILHIYSCRVVMCIFGLMDFWPNDLNTSIFAIVFLSLLCCYVLRYFFFLVLISNLIKYTYFNVIYNIVIFMKS